MSTHSTIQSALWNLVKDADIRCWLRPIHLSRAEAFLKTVYKDAYVISEDSEHLHCLEIVSHKRRLEN